MTDALSAHPAADIFPMLADEDLQSLAADIRSYGLLLPIILHDGLILDGRNRYAACGLAEVEPSFKPFEGTDPIAFVVSSNLKRRHLTPSQLAMVGADMLPLLEAQAKERQGTRADIPELFPGSSDEPQGDARNVAAAQLGINSHYVSDAKTIAAARPDLAQAIRTGERTIPDVKRELKRSQRVSEIVTTTQEELPTGKRYPILYADPPWRYEFAESTSREIEKEYPTMTLEDIQDLEVHDLAADNSMLFLWATSPKLTEALSVLEAWGFTYRTCMIWDKQKLGMGYYARQVHELLLIGMRGSVPVPEPANRPRSILSIPSTKHSEKPAEFREVIEAMYPEYDRIELFAREPATGWARWGNQS